jgi:hypothetical protein
MTGEQRPDRRSDPPSPDGEKPGIRAALQLGVIALLALLIFATFL